MKLTTHIHLVLRSRMYETIPPLPQYASMACCSVGKKKAHGRLYLYQSQEREVRKNGRGYKICSISM